MYGDCGWSNIIIDNLAPNSGQARVQESAYSYWGPIIFVSPRIYWYNANTTGSGQFGTAMLWGGGALWAHNDFPWTGVGNVSVDMLGAVELAIGVTCGILDPADATYVT